MRILHLVAGAGGMYCGSCLHGNTLASALRKAGEDVTLLPLYTPLRTDEENISLSKVAFGGINVYLQQRSSFFRRAPDFVDRLFDFPALIRWATTRRSGWRPEKLGALTVSMLQGERGRQSKELDKLSIWLESGLRPDVIHLNNLLLLGVARQLRRRLSAPVVCTLSGEDIFLEKLPEPHYSSARGILRERAAELDALVAMNAYFADFMSEYLSLPRGRIRVIPPGLNLAGHALPSEIASRMANDACTVSPATIGYLARVCPEKGLHLLAEAFEILSADAEMPPLRLRAAGFLDPTEQPYLDGIIARLTRQGLAGRFEYAGELDRRQKIDFLQSLRVMCLPTVYAESKGLSVLEAWANGIPTVLPAHGAFPEMIAETGGGLLCEPHNPASLAAALKTMILDPALSAECGRRAQSVVHDRYNDAAMARGTLELYRELLKGRGAGD
jgi:glycosyltransferase involved in cell wall biosynthesis